MEIYHDVPPVAGATTPHRQRRSRLGKKPLTPHNKQTPMQAFRQSLKDTIVTEKSTAKKKTVVQEKENTPASFRRSLRATLQEPQDKSRPRLLERQRLSTVTTSSNTSLLGPPKRVPPKTPNSILKSEFDLSMQEEDESFLVSPPPGALWNVFPSSTKLVIVSPQAAAEIQQSISTRKASKGKLPLFSPPLKPRILPTSTPETPTEGQWFTLNNEESRKTVKKEPQNLSSMFSSDKKKKIQVSFQEEKETTAPTNEEESGLLDFSEMFSSSSSKKKKSPPPLNVAKRFQKKRKSSPPTTTEVSSTRLSQQSPPLKHDEAIETEISPFVEPTTEESGLLDFSELFSLSKKKSPPKNLSSKLLVERKLQKSEPKQTVVESEQRSEPIESTTEEKGLSDFSDVFSSSKKESPPPRLLSRSQRKSSHQKTAVEEKSETKQALVESQVTELIKPISEENGLLDFSDIFSSSKKKSIPPKLSSRLQRKSPRQQTVQDTRQKQSKASSIVLPTPTEAKEDENGLMDFSNMFSSSKQSPPPNLANRLLQKRPSPLQNIVSMSEESKETALGSTAVRSSALRDSSNTASRKVPPRKERKQVVRSAVNGNNNKKSNRTTSKELAKLPPYIQRPGKYAAMATPSSRKYSVMATPSSHRRLQQRTNEVSSSKCIAGGIVDDWAEKQSETFVNWLNYTINPSDDDQAVDVVGTVGSPSCAGLRMLLLHRQLAQSRMKASGVFYDDEMQKVKNKIHSEISRGRLSIRSDRDIYYDLNLRRQVTALLQSYTTPWLRLGLEVLFGESIQVENSAHNLSKSYFSRMRSTLGSFIVDRVLSDSAVLVKYTKGKCRIPSGRFEKQFRAEMRSLVLYRIIVLILFLDQAKTANVLDKVPRLFAKGSKVKSSREVLLAFCRACLSSEGDFIKHLSRIGLTVTYKQDPVDELDFHIKNLATDLRDGTRLSRVTEIITQIPAKSLMSKLRLPSISRLQKLHNLNLALSSLRDFGVLMPQDVNAHHIADGHRDMVLKVMWSLIAHSCMEKLLKGDLVEQEIASVVRSNQARRKLKGLVAKDKEDHLYQPPKPFPNKSPEQVLKSLLFRWCQAICSSFDLKLVDFSNSFSDGKALCLLVHYYHPGVIRLDEILPTSNDYVEGLPMEQAIKNERANSTMASRRASQLGGIPKMIPYCDTKNPPNERSMLLCLTYLCSRLMESSREIFATILIQQCYRKYKSKVLLEKKQEAAWIIFQFWCEHKEDYFRSQKRCYSRAVAVVEDFVIQHWHSLLRMKRIRLEKEHRSSAAIQIQRLYRGAKGREEFLVLWEIFQATMVIQSVFRQFLCRRKYINIVHSATTIQKLARGNAVRDEIQRQESAALVIQKAWGNLVNQWSIDWAATCIQKLWRGAMVRQDLDQMLLEEEAACIIQKSWRGFCQFVNYEIALESTIVIQKVFRGFSVRKELEIHELKGAAIVIQSAWRGFAAQVQFNLDLFDIISVQTFVRRQIATKHYLDLIETVAVLQGAVRCWLARQKLQIKKKETIAAIVCQCAIRCWLSSRKISARQLLNGSASIIQSHWRKYVETSKFNIILATTVHIQASFRGALVRQEIELWNSSARIIQLNWRSYSHGVLHDNTAVQLQRSWRSYSSRKKFAYARKSVISLQKCWRGYMTRDCLEKQRFAATILQACWRRFQAQLNFELDVLEVIYVQSAARRFLAQKQANKRRKAIQIIQKASRWFQAVRKVERLRQERLELEHISSLNEMASIIQCHWRSFASCIKYRVMVGDVITIQSVIRRHLVLKSIREQITAATMIQSIFRGHVVRCSLWLYHSHASSIQAIIRGYSARIRFIVDRMDIVVVQSFARRWLVRQSVARQKCSAIVIQSLVRQKVAERELIKMKAMKMFEDRETYSSVLIQSFWRGTRCRRVAAEHAAARKIQKTWRCFVTHIDFLVQVMSIMSIQASARRFLAQRSFEKRYTSLIKIQAVFRGNFNRKQIKKKQHSATIIQAAYRSYLDRSLFLYEKYSATAIQATTRGFLARINIEIEHFAACEIQRIWRGYNQFVDYVYTVMAVIKIQSAMRRCLAVKKFEDTKLGLWADQCFVNKKAALIQQAFRAHLYRERMSNAAKIIQVAFREYIERWKANMLSRATIRLQAAFRARAVRQKRTRTITDIAHKIHRANVRAKQDPKQKLGFRTSNALTVLQTSTSLAEIMGAVKTLESSTRLSVNCCEVFTKASAAKILLDLIRACNRSLPHVELVHWILLTLENVGQHKAFLSSFSDCKSAEVFLDKVQMFRDKDGIFCLSVSLLRRVIHNDQNVLQFCGSYEHLKRLVSIHKLSLRRARPASIRHSNKKKKRKKFLKFERREVFDRTEALKALGHLISYIKLPISTPSGEKHFTF